MSRFRCLYGSLVLVLMVSGCGSLGPDRKEPFLQLLLTASTDPGTKFAVFADGRLMLEQGGLRRAKKTDAAGLQAMNELVRDETWQRLLLRVKSRQPPEPIVDDVAFVVRSESEEGLIWVRMNVDEIPEDLRPFLLRIDELFLKVYGPGKFPLYFSSLRVAS